MGAKTWERNDVPTERGNGRTRNLGRGDEDIERGDKVGWTIDEKQPKFPTLIISNTN